MRGVGFIFLLLAAMLPRPVVASEPMSLIVSRNAATTSLYIMAPAAPVLDAVAALGRDLRTDLSEPITFARGHEIAAQAMIHLAAQTQVLSKDGAHPTSALPTLLHAGVDRLPFDTPLQASISTTVCSTPTAPIAPLSELYLYTGLRADVGLDAADLVLELPGDGFAHVPVAVRLYERGRFVDAFETTVSADGVLRLSPDAAGRAIPVWPVILGSLAFGLVAVTGLQAVRRTRRHAALRRP
ncbi:hypothetical protein Dshi_0625 [Dinoroseobacter shibae DFL 12 = DSM 16493]|jgi:hypothetical protein|uniref:Transmembrane protein n=2 Tax=Dinoroseobacter shibae TaxID=215813 RepID=A8LPP8_DINSH|nr:hypothetical protein Dshi_0625 [Dinoroseobacter shibae DFL 12 = DSM 16493]